MSFLPSIVALSTMAVIAIWLTVARGGIDASAPTLRIAVLFAACTIGLQFCHFLEEAFTGFNRRFPELFGLPPLAMQAFVAVNLVAVTVWVISTAALSRGSGAGLFPLWFLGVACIANAVAHPALSVVTGGYFPGLATSPIVGVAGWSLLRQLMLITQETPHNL